jgi:hypothetical protein
MKGQKFKDIVDSERYSTRPHWQASNHPAERFPMHYLYVPPQVQSVAVTRITFSLMPHRPHDNPTVPRPFSHEESDRRLRRPHFVR